MKNKTRFVPMLFSTDMVKAIDIHKTKTETRRTQGLELINENPEFFIYNGKINDEHIFILKNEDGSESDFYKPIKSKINKGDIIWVRETFKEIIFKGEKKYLYKANPDHQAMKWKPSLFMPKEACRIFLKCTSVHIERLHDITEQSAINEGIEIIHKAEKNVSVFKRYDLKEKLGTTNPIYSYQTLWQKINGKESWDENPFVWVYKFERVERPNDFC
jgi:hypothetical protein